MSAPNTQIAWGVRYKINNTFFNATSGEINYGQEAVDVTDSESAGGRQRAAGVYEAEVTIRGNLARDVNISLTPFLIEEGVTIGEIAIYFQGIGDQPDLFFNVYCDRFRKTAGPDMNNPASYEFHGFTANYQRAGQNV